ncbi:MAG: ATP-binding cassette domain-containing protein [Ruminococcus sp.]|nr:ATP-binding cassette domain-containing protein [Ruminococcus sp.]
MVSVIFKNASVRFDAKKINIVKGTNGIGKSTLFHLITGMIKADEGQISVCGVCTEELSEVNFQKDLFYLPQNDPKFNITSDELYKSAVPECSLKARNFTQKLGVSSEVILNNSLYDLSGGERKKVFLALAFAIDPKVLLLDEPTNSLNYEGKKTLLKMLCERNSGAVIITHDEIFDEFSDGVFIVQEWEISLG